MSLFAGKIERRKVGLLRKNWSGDSAQIRFEASRRVIMVARSFTPRGLTKGPNLTTRAKKSKNTENLHIGGRRLVLFLWETASFLWKLDCCTGLIIFSLCGMIRYPAPVYCEVVLSWNAHLE